jgi:hypothetical protein
VMMFWNFSMSTIVPIESKPNFFLSIVNVSVSIFAIQKKIESSVQLDLRVRSKDANKPISYEIVKLGKPASEQDILWKVSKSQTRMITVQKYYNEHYNKVLQWVNKIPCLV